MIKTHWSRVLREVLAFWLIFAVFTGSGLLYLAKKRQAGFDAKIYEHLLTGESRFKEKIDDPCKYSIVGDPDTTEYVKLTLKCKTGQSNNTLALGVFKDQTIRGVLTEFGRINGFAFSPDQNWNCLLNLQPVKDMSLPVTPGSDLSCSYD